MAQPTTRGATLLSGAVASGGIKDYWLAVPINTALSNLSELDLGIDLPANAYVLDVLLDVKVAEVTGSTKAVNIGILTAEGGGDPAGFISGISVATTGFKRPVAAITVGGTESFFATTTRGAFLSPSFLAGANVAGDVGTCYEQAFATSSIAGKSVCARSLANALVEFRGVAYFHILQLAS